MSVTYNAPLDWKHFLEWFTRTFSLDNKRIGSGLRFLGSHERVVRAIFKGKLLKLMRNVATHCL